MAGARRSLVPLAAAGFATLLFLTGCNADNYNASYGTANSVQGSGANKTTVPVLGPGGGMAMTPPPGAPPALNAIRAFDVGVLVVDNAGLVLYRYDKDSARPPKSNCEGDCAQKWPPLRVSDGLQLNGIDRKLIGSVTRQDGTDQVTLGGWPLYRHITDQEPGQSTGMAVDGAWFPVAPDGKKVQQNANAGTPGVPGL
jgi:predicted lipoprotein with Yx(FWY)xxD motif